MLELVSQALRSDYSALAGLVGHEFLHVGIGPDVFVCRISDRGIGRLYLLNDGPLLISKMMMTRTCWTKSVVVTTTSDALEGVFLLSANGTSP